MAFNKAKALQEAEKLVIQGKISQAIKRYFDILERDPSDVILLNTIGDLYIRDRNVSEGLKQFYRLAEAYVQDGFTLKAIAIYKKIVKLEPDSVDPLLKLVELYQAQRLAREARELYYQVAECYKRKKQNDKVLETLRKVVQLDVEYAPARVRLGAFCEEIGRKDEATQVYLESAQLAFRRGDLAAAQVALKKVQELDPDNPQLHQRLVYTQQGDAEGAKRYAQMAGGQEALAAEAIPPQAVPAPALRPESLPPLPAQPGPAAPEEIDLASGFLRAAVQEPETAPTPHVSATASAGSAFDVWRLASPAPPPAPAFEIQEIDLSEDWESFQARPASASPAPETPQEAASFNYEDSRIEVNFYLENGFLEEAIKAVEELERTLPGEPRIAELRALVGAHTGAMSAELAHKAPITDSRGGAPEAQPKVKIPDQTCANYSP